MFYGLLNDIIQRFLTFNKKEQRENLLKNMNMLNLKPWSKCLDFGCGTGLFSKVFTHAQLSYVGYDIDERLTRYANKLYYKDGCFFTASLDEVKKQAPFDLIVTNCCLHHINDDIVDDVLITTKSLLRSNGTFLLIDIILTENKKSILRKFYRKLERGAFVRGIDGYCKIVEKHYTVDSIDLERSHLFSIKGNPIYNDLIVLIGKA